MFRKDPQIKALSNLKSSERRRMLTTILTHYSLPTNLTKEHEERILPSTIKQTTFHTHKGITGTVYTDEHQTPLWFKTKDSELIPTVYTLWRAPYILPLVQTHTHVIEVLEGGADLMLPGSVPPFPEGAKKWRIVGVVDRMRPGVVMAVGRAELDLSVVERTVGEKGVAVQVYHTNGDALCALSKLKIKPPESVEMGYELKEETKEEAKEEEKEEEAEPVAQEEDKEDTVDEVTESMDQLTTEDVDYLFKRSLFQTLTQTPPIELPLPASQFMSHVVNNLASDHHSIQIKKTSWKKSAKFLKAMEKDGFLKLKGKGDDITVVSRATRDTNDELKNFVPYKIKKRTGAPTQKKSTGSTQLILTKFYKCNSPLRPLFNDLDMDFTKFYTTNELREIINSYIAKHGLVNPRNKKQVVLDDTLSSIIPGPENCITRDKLLDPVLKKCTEHYQITNTTDPDLSTPPRKGPVPEVKIVTETKIGRKVITRVCNFETFGISPDELSAELKVKCSGSSTIGHNVQNPKLVEVTVQGPHSKTIVELLTRKYGLNSAWIAVEDKSKGKGKKK